LPAEQQVRRLSLLGQMAGLGQGCDVAARHLGADPRSVERFVRSWDTDTLSRFWLLQQLYELWLERLDDAEAVQEMLLSGPALPGFAESPLTAPGSQKAP
jgi:hypothetical protein